MNMSNNLRRIVPIAVMFSCIALPAPTMAQWMLPQSQTYERRQQWQREGVSDQQRHFAYGVTLRESYDSNVTTAEEDEIASFVTSAGPDLHFAWSSPTTDVAVHYTYWATYYSHRPGGSDIDQAHEFTFDLSHEFTPRFRVNLYDQFRPGFEPELENGNRQRLGNYIDNKVGVSTAYAVGGRWEVPVSFNHHFLKYEDSELSEISSYQRYQFTGGLHYNFRPQTRFGMDFSHAQIIYEGMDRDAQYETMSFYVNHAFTPRLSANAHLGMEAGFYDAVGGTYINPNINVSVNYSVGPRTVLTGSFAGRTQPTERPEYESQYTYSLMVAAAHQFTSRLTTGLNVMWIPARYENALATPDSSFGAGFAHEQVRGDRRDDTVAMGANISYQFNMHWRAEVGATYTTVTSEFGGYSYDRAVGYIQTRVGF